MKFKNFFLSCSTSGGRSRKLEEKQQKYGNLRPVSPPPPLTSSTTVHPSVTVDLRDNSYLTRPSSNHHHNHHLHHNQSQNNAQQQKISAATGNLGKTPLANSYSNYSCGSSSSHGSSKSGTGSYSSSSSSSASASASMSKNKRTLDSRSGRYRAERQKNKCTSRQCCIDKDFHQNYPAADEFDLQPVPTDDLGVKVGDRVVWLRESPYSNESGTVRWIGVIEGEEIAGIEFDHPIGLGSGWYKNRQLFSCDPQSGGLVAVAGLILEEDYFVSSDISSSVSSSPVSDKVADQRLKASSPAGGSAGHSSPSPSCSSSTSLNSSGFYSNQSPSGYNVSDVTSSTCKQHQTESKKSPNREESCFVAVQSSPKGLSYGDADFEYSWRDNAGSREPQRLPVVDCGDASRLNLDKTKHLLGASDQKTSGTVANNPTGNSNNMPIPCLQAPLREEDVERINGRQKGIQGHRNSCYLDATLFSMFSFSGVFDSILLQDYRFHNRKEESDEELARNVQRILREEIVNPLRKDLFCNARNVMNLRETMQHLDVKLTSEEMDPQEFLQLLFDKVLNLDEFMSLSSGQSDFFHQVLVGPSEDDRNKIPSIQQLFEQSLILQELKLKRVPQPALILQMPRSGNKYKMYDGILPNLTIDITDLLEDTPRMCIICGGLANFECPQCYGKFNADGSPRDNSIAPAGSGAESTAFCETCLQQCHKRKERQSHLKYITPIKYSFPAPQYFPNSNNTSSSSINNPSSYFFGQSPIGASSWGNPSFNRNPTPLISHTSSIPLPPMSPNNPSLTYPSRSIPRVTMDLFAVICIETSHFVSFVKCGTDRKAPWVFFDSMADRVENSNGTGHNVPQVKLLPQMGNWLDALEKGHGDLKLMDMDKIPPELKRLLADPYMCLYYSPQSSMYS